MNGSGRAVLYALLALAFGLLAAMVLSVPILLAQVRITQVDNTHRSQEQSETLSIVKDCTQPSGACFRDGQRRTADAVVSIQRGILLAAVCSVDLDQSQPVDVRIRRITACVTKRLTP